jgi:uncharacterized protein
MEKIVVNVSLLQKVNKEKENTATILPFHLSTCVHNLDAARYFYKRVLGIEERRASQTSAHFDFYGCQLTLHEVPGYSAKSIQREVDAEDVPVPHFGAALSFAEFEKVRKQLIKHNIEFVMKPHVRFINKRHEQHVMFIEDPSGHGIEIKSFTQVPVGEWA